jgi:hypothetical protein
MQMMIRLMQKIWLLLLGAMQTTLRLDLMMRRPLQQQRQQQKRKQSQQQTARGDAT